MAMIMFNKPFLDNIGTVNCPNLQNSNGSV